MGRIGVHLAIVILLVLVPLIGTGQESNFKKWLHLKGPERRWVLAHLLVARDALRITMNARKVIKEQAENPILDEYGSGGKQDAFRHVFWMASLSAEIKWKKVWRLGNAHEKTNKKDWRRGRYEDGSPPDKIAGEMDFWNNKVGLEIGKNNRNLSEAELVQLVLIAITDGKCKIIKRNAKGDFLDEKGNVIGPADWEGKWENTRCLIFSNQAG